MFCSVWILFGPKVIDLGLKFQIKERFFGGELEYKTFLMIWTHQIKSSMANSPRVEAITQREGRRSTIQ